MSEARYTQEDVDAAVATRNAEIQRDLPKAASVITSQLADMIEELVQLGEVKTGADAVAVLRKAAGFTADPNLPNL